MEKVLCCLFAFLWTSLAAAQDEMVVRVCNVAQMPEATLEKAEEEAGFVLGTAGSGAKRLDRSSATTERELGARDFVLTVAAFRPSRAKGPSYRPATLSITIRLYNISSASVRDVKQMRESTGRIFGHAGIEIEWIPCDPGPHDSAVCPDHRGPENRTIVFAQLIDVPIQRKQGRNQTRPGLLGRVNHLAASVAVFYTTALTMEQDAQGSVTKGEILGYALAHEIGHLLLQSDAHSPIGIMKETFGRNDLSDMGMERLLFTSAESRSIRERLLSPRGLEARLQPVHPHRPATERIPAVAPRDHEFN